MNDTMIKENIRMKYYQLKNIAIKKENMPVFWHIVFRTSAMHQ